VIFLERWLIVTKENDFENDTINDWIDLEEKKELTFYLDTRLKKHDRVLIYKSGQWRVISHIFEVKNSPLKKNGKFKVHLHQKKHITKPITLLELKEHKIIKTNKKFRKRVYKIPLCCWSDIIGLITKKNPKLLDPYVPKLFSGPNNEGYHIQLKKDLIKLIKTIEKYDIYSLNEEATKYTIILPILEKLGWNIYNPWEVYPENPIDDKKVDYILKDCNSTQICIEAKKASEEDLNQHKMQIISYCASANIDLGILTSGLIWKFYKLNYYENSLGAIKKIKKTKEINILKESPERCVDKFIEYFWMGKKTSKRHPRKDKFLNDLIKTIKAIDEKAISNYNESAVKQFILVPLLKNLGWKISPSEISFDYWINLKKVDYILENNKKFKTCIEVKSLGSQLDFDAEENLLNYALNGNFRMAVLTDGNDWRFFYFKNKDYYGDSKFKIKNKTEKELVNTFTNLLSKDKVINGDNLKYLEKII